MKRFIFDNLILHYAKSFVNTLFKNSLSFFDKKMISYEALKFLYKTVSIQFTKSYG